MATATKYKIIAATLLGLSVFISYCSLSSAQAIALSGGQPSFATHAGAFILSLVLLIGAIYYRAMSKRGDDRLP